jgi:hypothetical protein
MEHSTNDSRVFAAPNPALARAAIEPPPASANRALWYGVFAPPLAWSIDALTSVALHHDYCAALIGKTFRPWSGVGVLLTVVGLVMLALALGGGVAAWRAYSVVGTDTGFGDTDLDRRRFMARAGMLASVLFSYAILLRLIAPMILPPAFCGS